MPDRSCVGGATAAYRWRRSSVSRRFSSAEPAFTRRSQRDQDQDDPFGAFGVGEHCDHTAVGYLIKAVLDEQPSAADPLASEIHDFSQTYLSLFRLSDFQTQKNKKKTIAVPLTEVPKNHSRGSKFKL